MNDNDLIWYVSFHSRTERALHSGSQIKRLLKLAGEPEDHLGVLADKQFYGFHEDLAKPLVDQALERRKDLKEELARECPRTLSEDERAGWAYNRAKELGFDLADSEQAEVSRRVNSLKSTLWEVLQET